MIRPPLSPALLQESNDVLRAVDQLLDDVTPAVGGPTARPLDLHLALVLLERIYELETPGPDDEEAERFRRALDAEYQRFTDLSSSGGG